MTEKAPVSDQFTTQDGHSIAYNRFDPATPNGKVICICPAMAVWQKFYRDFAFYLAEKGYVVYTFDFRGIGASPPSTLKGLDCDIVKWAQQDNAGMVRFIRKEHPEATIYSFCHSLGGQILGFFPESKEVEKYVFVGCSLPGYNGYPKYGWPLLTMIWYVILPGVSNLMGYFPGKKMGMFGNLPKGVAKQWAKWCRTKGYGTTHPEAKYFDKVTAKILTFSFEDDTTAPQKTIEALHPVYSHAQLEHRHLDPKDLGIGKVGHFGYFKKKAREALWEGTVEWLEGTSESPP